MANHRKYRSPIRVTITTDEWRRELLKLLSIEASQVFNSAIDTIVENAIKNDKINSSILSRIVDDLKSQYSTISKKIENLESVIEGKVNSEIKATIQRNTLEIEASGYFKSNIDYWTRLPENDFHGDFADEWEHHAKELSYKCGFDVSPSDCMNFIRHRKNASK